MKKLNLVKSDTPPRDRSPSAICKECGHRVYKVEGSRDIDVDCPFPHLCYSAHDGKERDDGTR